MRPYALDRSDDWHRVGGRVGRSADADRPDRARRSRRRRGPAPACPRLAARPPRTVLRRVDLRGVRRPDLATFTLVVAPDVRLGSAIDQHSPVVQSDEAKVPGLRVEQRPRVRPEAGIRVPSLCDLRGGGATDDQDASVG